MFWCFIGILFFALSSAAIEIGELTFDCNEGEIIKVNNQSVWTCSNETESVVYKNEFIKVTGFKAPTISPATYIDWGLNGAWEFSDGANDVVSTTIRVPTDIDITQPMELKIGFASECITGNVTWQLEYLYLSQNEDSTQVAQEILNTTTPISNIGNGLTIATITGLDILTATDQLILLRITRLGNDELDTLECDCVMLGTGLKYISDKRGRTI